MGRFRATHPAPLAVTLVAGACLVLAGCRSGPRGGPPERPFRAAVPIPEKWSAKQADSSQVQPWLDDFEAPRLEALVREAFGANFDLRAAAGRVARAAAQARVAEADRLPGADLRVESSRQKINTFGPRATGGARFDDNSLDVNIAWELDLWGKLRDRARASLAEFRASREEFRSARLSLAAQVSKAWFDLLEARRQVDIAESNARAFAENERTLEQRFARGLAEGLNLRLIRTQAASARADAAARENARAEAARRLETLLGRYPADAVEAASETPRIAEAPPAGLPADLLARRPDVAAAERRLKAARRRLGAAEKELLPAVTLNASGGTSTREFNNLLDRNLTVWSLAGSLAQPIFQGGRIVAGIDRAKGDYRVALAQYRETALNAFREAETALAAAQRLRRQARQVEKALEEAEAAETLAWEQYRRGTADFITALDAQRTAAETRSRRASIRNRRLRNRVDLYLALGGPALPANDRGDGAPSPPKDNPQTLR